MLSLAESKRAATSKLDDLNFGLIFRKSPLSSGNIGTIIYRLIQFLVQKKIKKYFNILELFSLMVILNP
jgi:hypothetical protein